MRRTLIALATSAIMLLIPVGPALAGKVTVRPDPVKHGERLKIIAKDCESGDNWEAFVKVRIYNSKDHRVYKVKVPASDSGRTVVKLKIRKKKFPKGMYLAEVDCIHEFDEGGTGVWYEKDREFRVKRR